MSNWRKTTWVSVVGFIALIVVPATFRSVPASAMCTQTEISLFRAIVGEMTIIDTQFFTELGDAKTPEERERIKTKRMMSIQSLAERCFDLAKRTSDARAEIAALMWAADKSAFSETGRQANERLSQRIIDVEFVALCEGVKFANIQTRSLNRIAPGILAAAKKNLNHPDAVKILAAVCGLSVVDADVAPAEPFDSAADLIVEHFADSPDLAVVNFCEFLGGLNTSPSWAPKYEKHLRAILEKNRDRSVRATATMALASVVESVGEKRQIEAQELYQSFLNQFDGKTEYQSLHIEQALIGIAQQRLAVLETIGKTAPEIDGFDLDEQQLKLSDLKGKVVLLSFWATWCGPCITMIPHERELVAKFKDRPFVILGINGDETLKAAKAGVTKYEVTWKSFQNRHSDGSAIFDEWHCFSWPAFILIDKNGTIRRRWNAEGHQQEICVAIESLLTEKSDD